MNNIKKTLATEAYCQYLLNDFFPLVYGEKYWNEYNLTAFRLSFTDYYLTPEQAGVMKDVPPMPVSDHPSYFISETMDRQYICSMNILFHKQLLHPEKYQTKIEKIGEWSNW